MCFYSCLFSMYVFSAFDKDFNVDLFNNVDMLSPVYQEYR